MALPSLKHITGSATVEKFAAEAKESFVGTVRGERGDYPFYFINGAFFLCKANKKGLSQYPLDRRPEEVISNILNRLSHIKYFFTNTTPNL